MFMAYLETLHVEQKNVDLQTPSKCTLCGF